jgi:hypothetical protein
VIFFFILFCFNLLSKLVFQHSKSKKKTSDLLLHFIDVLISRSKQQGLWGTSRIGELHACLDWGVPINGYRIKFVSAGQVDRLIASRFIENFHSSILKVVWNIKFDNPAVMSSRSQVKFDGVGATLSRLIHIILEDITERHKLNEKEIHIACSTR